jgi:hypothetical protein
VEVDESINLPACLSAHQIYRLVGGRWQTSTAMRRATVVAIQSAGDGELWLRVVVQWGWASILCGANVRGSFGLSGMRERARLINAQLTIDSTPGKGTTGRDTVGVATASFTDFRYFLTNDTGFFCGQAQRVDSDIVNTNEDGVAWLRVGR